jgi:hypothetical protein
VNATSAGFLTAKPAFGQKAVQWVASGKCVFNSTDVGATGGFGPATITVVNGVSNATNPYV